MHPLHDLYEQDPYFGDQEAEDRDHEFGAALGDPRRCKVHGTVISSPDGMFDGICNQCEYEEEEHSHSAPLPEPVATPPVPDDDIPF